MSRSTRLSAVSILGGVLLALLTACGAASTTNALPPHYYVSAAAAKGGDGSAEAPFATIFAALKQSETDELREVRIQVASGKYPEGTLLILRPTSITGTGAGPSILGRFDVASPAFSLTNCSLVDPDGIAVAVSSEDADVALLGVEINNAAGYGLRQQGGSLVLADVTVAHTAASLSDPSSGAAIFVGGGIQVTMVAVHLHHNVRGLYAGGVGTHVDALNLRVEHSGFHPSLLEHMATVGCAVGFYDLGAVEFGDSAIAEGRDWFIADSVIAGLYAHDAAQVTVLRLTVTRTLALEQPAPGAACDTVGGYGAVAHQAGQLNLRGFSIIDSYLCGVVVGQAPGSAIDLAFGEIRGAVVGACVQLPGFNVARLNHFVDYIDVGAPLQAPSYGIPPPPGSI